MAPNNEIAVVICHGSYHSPAPYQPLVDALKARGFDAYCPQLPTCDLSKLNVGDVTKPDFDRGPPPNGYPQGNEDARVVINLLEDLIHRQHKYVLVAGHSAGGWVATEVAIPSLQARKGQAGGIIGVFYFGAFLIPVGESINTFFQPKDGTVVVPPYMRFHKHGAAGLGTMVDAEKFLFHDIPEEEAKKWATTLTASPILTDPLTNNAYISLPCAYLVLEGDLMLPKEYQEAMVKAQSGQDGFTVYRCPAGHGVFLSWTAGLVEKMEDFIKKIAP